MNLSTKNSNILISGLVCTAMSRYKVIQYAPDQCLSTTTTKQTSDTFVLFKTYRRLLDLSQNTICLPYDYSLISHIAGKQTVLSPFTKQCYSSADLSGCQVFVIVATPNIVTYPLPITNCNVVDVLYIHRLGHGSLYCLWIIDKFTSCAQTTPLLINDSFVYHWQSTTYQYKKNVN